MQRVGVLCALPRVLGELGVDPAGVLADAGLGPDALDRPDRWIPFAAGPRVLVAASRRSGCAHIGLSAAKGFGLAQLGLLGELMRNSPTVGDALRSYVVHQRLFSHGFVPYLFDYGERAHFGVAVYHPVADDLSATYDLLLGATVVALRELLGEGWRPREVHLPREQPADTRPYKQHFRGRLKFDAAHAALVVASAELEQRVAGADPARFRALDQEASARFDGDLLPQLYRSLRILLVQGEVTAAMLAQQFAMHERTLSRRLRAQGVRFQAILDDVRFEAARHLLRDTGLDITNVALALGYAEGSAFTKAFHRWSGMSPSQWRAGGKDAPSR
jgi:AraC-like DNA-binding protein